ncbi:unnamed protein product, partial [Allacma fusca]
MLGQEANWDVFTTLFNGIQSYNKIIRRIAWYRRFFKWIKTKLPMNAVLEGNELDQAELILLKAVQKGSFPRKPDNFNHGTAVVLGVVGLFRVKTRIIN